MAKDPVLQLGEFTLRGISKAVAARVESLSPRPTAVASGKSNGERQVACVVTSDQVIVIGAVETRTLALSDLEKVSSTGFRAKDGRVLDFQAFSEADQRLVMDAAASRAGLQSLSEAMAPAPAVPLLTVHTIPGYEIVQSLGLVTSFAVVSRNVFSDAGSDFVSAFGGRLGGIEKALESALAHAKAGLFAKVKQLGADAVIGINVDVQVVADKAQAIVISGTAVRTRASDPL